MELICTCDVHNYRLVDVPTLQPCADDPRALTMAGEHRGPGKVEEMRRNAAFSGKDGGLIDLNSRYGGEILVENLSLGNHG